MRSRYFFENDTFEVIIIILGLMAFVSYGIFTAIEDRKKGAPQLAILVDRPVSGWRSEYGRARYHYRATALVRLQNGTSVVIRNPGALGGDFVCVTIRRGVVTGFRTAKWLPMSECKG